MALLKTPVKIAMVEYTNTLPFQWAIKHQPLQWPYELHQYYPRKCAHALMQGAADLALLPVGQLSALNNYHICSPFGISANGRVDSVKLYSEVPLQNITELLLDYQSATSVALAKLLCKTLWNIQPVFIETQPGFEKNISGNKAGIVIGDRTFSMNGHFPLELDLSEQWQIHTRLPFVFAVWVSLKPLDPDFLTAFEACLSYGISNIDRAILTRPSPEHKLLHTYLKQRIEYRLDDRKYKALEMFLNLLKNSETSF